MNQTIEDIAHKIATFAMEQKDNVGMYTAIRFKVIGLLEERERELEIAITKLTQQANNLIKDMLKDFNQK